MLALIVSFALTAQPDAKPLVPVVLVVERAATGELAYQCNGRHLDAKRVLSGLENALDPNRPADTPVFVLFDDGVSIDKVFETGSLLTGKAGLRHVRYFAFSKKTSVMMELSPNWDRWKLSFDGKLEKKPW